MKLTLVSTVAAALCLSAGCKKEEKPATDTPAAGDAAVAKAAADAAPAANNPAMLNQMKHCPSAVVGAATSVEKTDEAVLVIVSAKDETGKTQVRERAQHLASVAGTDSPEIKHTGEGTGGGMGKCPVVLTGTTVAAEEIDSGTRITLTPKDASKLEEIYTQAAERAKSLNERSGTAHGSGAGGRHGKGAGGGHGGQEKGDEPAGDEPAGDEPDPAAGAGVVKPKPVGKKPIKKKAAPKDEGGW